MGGKAPDPPDYRPLMQAQMAMSREQAAAAREQLAWAKEQWNADRAFQNEIFGITRPILEAEAAFATQNAGNRQKLLELYTRQAEGETAWAEQQRQRYRDIYQPLEDQFVREAKTYDSPEKIAELRGRAMADVSDQFDAARKNAASRLESYGIDPGQTRAAALDTGVRLQEAATKAAAGEGARLQAEATGRAMRGEAINIGKGYPAQVAQSYATAMGGGQAANGMIGQSMQAGVNGLNGLSAARNQQTGMGTSMMGSPTSWMSGAANSMSNAGTTMFQGYNAQMQKYQADQASWGGIGSGLGSLAGFALGFNDGGEIPADPRDPAGKKDRFAIAVAGGEHVIPTSVTRRLGSDYFDKLILKHGTPEEQAAAAQRLKTGKPGGSPARGREAGAIPLAMG